MIGQETVYYHDEQKTGTIPTQFGLLANVTEFSLSNCRLTGTLPTQLYELGGWRFRGSRVSDRLSSPHSGCLSKLKQKFDVSWNWHISGTIPTELGAVS